MKPCCQLSVEMMSCGFNLDGGNRVDNGWIIMLQVAAHRAHITYHTHAEHPADDLQCSASNYIELQQIPHLQLRIPTPLMSLVRNPYRLQSTEYGVVL